MNQPDTSPNNLVELSIPTPSSAAAEQANSWAKRASELVIKTPEQYETAATDLKIIKAKWNEIEAQRKALKKPIDEAAARIQKFFAGPLNFLERAEKIIKGKLIVYSDEQDRLRREEQRRANEKAEKERLRLLAAAERNAAKGNEAKAESFAERAQQVVAPVAQQRAPTVAGIAIPLVWDFEITDEKLIPREWLCVDEPKIRKHVAAMKGDTKIPGVTVRQVKRIAAGST